MLIMATGCELPVIIASTGIIQACDQDMWLDSDVVFILSIKVFNHNIN